MKEDLLCCICQQEEPIDRKKKKKKSKRNSNVGWVGCDKCDKWTHTVCARISEALLLEMKNHSYLCEKCSIVGSFYLKAPTPDSRSQDAQENIAELTSKITKLESEIATLQAGIKKQFDRLQNRMHAADRWEEKAASNREIIENVENKLETIESGARLANACSQSVNCCRIAINKVPFHPGENVRSVVSDFLDFLDIRDRMSQVTACFRLPVKPSKWTDRNLTPTIMVAFDTRELKSMVLRRYFEKHKEAKLCNLNSALSLEYRFTVNEMLSIKSFRIRNLAMRLKQKGAVQSVFIRNDRVSVKLTGQTSYVPVENSSELLKLIEPDVLGESSVFFDAVSAASSSCC